MSNNINKTIFKTKENSKRYTLHPLQHEDLYKFYRGIQSSIWHVDSIPYHEDKKDWEETLNENEKHFVKHVLAFFAASDGIVNENLAVNMQTEVGITEAELFYSEQIAQEFVHSDVYSKLILAAGITEDEKLTLLDSLNTMPAVKKKSQWAIDWIDKGNIVDKLIAFSIVEGIMFSASFCAIYYMKSKKLLPALSEANDYIARDEAYHRDFAVYLYRYYVNEDYKLDNERIKQMISSAVEVEVEFVSKALPVSLIGMDADKMAQYIRHVANNLYIDLTDDEQGMYNDSNPFPFMEMIALKNKTNFFEFRPTEYTASSLGNGNIELTEDF